MGRLRFDKGRIISDDEPEGLSAPETKPKAKPKKKPARKPKPRKA